LASVASTVLNVLGCIQLMVFVFNIAIYLVHGKLCIHLKSYV